MPYAKPQHTFKTMKQSVYDLWIRIFITIIIVCVLLSAFFLYQGYTERQQQAQLQTNIDNLANIINEVKTGRPSQRSVAPVESKTYTIETIVGLIIFVWWVIWAGNRPSPIQPVKEKSLPQAIGLNLFFPGLGYIYMDKWISGILIGLLMFVAFMSGGIILAIPAWFSMNIIMAIDMFIISNKNKAKIIAETTKKCPACAELIKKEANICRFCNMKQD